MPISDKQRIDWLDNPVTIDFRGKIEEAMGECMADRGIDSYFKGEPNKTQEALAQIVGALQAFDIVIEALGGEDVSSREDSGISEQVWGLSGGE